MALPEWTGRSCARRAVHPERELESQRLTSVFLNTPHLLSEAVEWLWKLLGDFSETSGAKAQFSLVRYAGAEAPASERKPKSTAILGCATGAAASTLLTALSF